jgi:predicted metal-dependent phosphoesterase TrpH
VLIDLHNHTFPKSDDSLLSVDDLIINAKKRGLDGICLTDHDQFWSELEINNLKIKYDFPIFEGSEITTEEGHIIVFGLNHYIFGMHNIEFLSNIVHNNSGFMIAAHPYRRRFDSVSQMDPTKLDITANKSKNDLIFTIVDAIETINGRGENIQNTFSQKICDLIQCPSTAGSDAHKLEDIAKVSTQFTNTIRSVDELIIELKSGRFEPILLK